MSGIMLAACAGGGTPVTGAAAPTGQLFASGLKDVRALYLEPVSMRQVALAGAAHLAALDSKLAVEDSFGTRFADALTVSYDGRDIGFFSMPTGDDEGQWGDLIGRVVAIAKQASPRLAAVPEKRIDAAVFHGITASLDRFSRYVGPEAAQIERAERDGLGGVGITLDSNDRLLRVAAVSPHSPAEKAGIRPEDQIVAINGVTTKGCSHEDAVQQLRGPIGSAVALRVLRPGGAEARNLQLRRAMINAPSVTMSRDGDIAVFRVASFNRTTAQLAAAALAEAQRQAGGQLAGIVLDLRGDPGGLLDQAVSLADLFIHDGPILATVGRNRAARQYFAASGKAIAPRLPIAVLINGGSASAAEIVAAALQDAGRAVVIGSASYGKGTVQTVMHLPNDGELVLTWARLVAPAGYLLQQHGVVPTVCTAGLPDNGDGLAAGLPRAVSPAPALLRSRAALDESGWAQLRQSCPPQHTRPAIDLTLAERLLADPRLYSEALHALPAGSAIGNNLRGPATLTQADRTLSSRLR